MNSISESKLESRWDLIESALSESLLSVDDLEVAIFSFNSRFRKSWSFRCLKGFFLVEATLEERILFFDVTLPKMQKMCLEAKKQFPRPPKLLKKGSNGELYLTQEQCATILVQAFFCVFPRRNSFKSGSEYSSYNQINFNRIFGLQPLGENFEKLRTLIHYFNRVVGRMPTGVVSFQRTKLGIEPDWEGLSYGLSNVEISDNGVIETEGRAYIQMDFANKYIGGGALGGGLVQEEIQFIIQPELICSMLVTEELDDDECLGKLYGYYSNY